MSGFVVVICGPSGVGKGTVVNRLLETMPELDLSISSTTREPRTGESNGREYFFLTEEEFERKISSNEFLEWAQVHGKKYGTDSRYVGSLIAQGRIVILEIDVQGAEIIRKKLDDAVFIFLTPPSVEELERRLRGRNTESEEKVQLRLETAQKELEKKSSFPYIVENDTINDTVDKIKQIILSERRRKVS